MKEIQGHFDPNIYETEGYMEVCGCHKRKKNN